MDGIVGLRLNYEIVASSAVSALSFPWNLPKQHEAAPQAWVMPGQGFGKTIAKTRRFLEDGGSGLRLESFLQFNALENCTLGRQTMIPLIERMIETMRRRKLLFFS